MSLPTIDGALGIRVDEVRGGYCADARKLPGTPPCGWGKTINEAKYDLLAKLLWDMVYVPIDRSYQRIVLKLLRETADAATK